MSESRIKRSRLKILALLGVAAMTAVSMWGCGTDGYDNPVTTTNAPAIIDAPTLKSWVDEGKLNAPAGRSDRVVLVSVTTMANYTTASRLHIPGAVLLDSGTQLYDTREEAQGPVPSMVPTGAQMDTVIKKLGIDDKTTIVLTIPKKSTDPEHYAQSRAYFTLRYWGFDRNRIKILNGGDDAWDAQVAASAAGYTPLTKAVPSITPTTYSVAKNKDGLKDVVRASMGEMYQRIDALIKDSSGLTTSQMLDVRGAAVSPYVTNAFRTTAMAFLGDRVNNEATRNRLYPTKDVLLQRMSTQTVTDGAGTAFLSPTKKTIVMCAGGVSASPSFVLFDAVLGVPEGDIMLYDGSANQWTGYSSARIAAASPSASVGQLAAWAFDTPVITGVLTSTRAQGTMPATGAALLPHAALYAPSNLLMNQIETADKAYMDPETSKGGAVSGAGGGC